VTPVRDQGSCGDCWAFATAAIVESAWAISKNVLQVLSPQNLLDCDTANTQNPSNGCLGRSPSDATNYVIASGLHTEKSYPYHGAQRGCGWPGFPSATISSANFFNQGDYNSILGWVANNGPVSIVIDATPLMHYGGGIVAGGCVGLHNHAVTVVGYGSFLGVNFWIVKNSWSAQWGASGYFLLQRGPQNWCGANDYAIGVTV